MDGQQFSSSDLDTAIIRGHDLAEASKAWKDQYKQTGRIPEVAGIEGLDPKTISTDPASFQFRPECGPTGVCPGQELKGPFDYGRAGIALVYEANSGERFIVDGHHRLDYAKHHPQENITLYSDNLKEREGWSKPMAKAIGAMKNLAEGSTSVQEVAESLNVSPDLLKERWERNVGPLPELKHKEPAPEKAPEPISSFLSTPAKTPIATATQEKTAPAVVRVPG